MTDGPPLLQVEGLRIGFGSPARRVVAVDGIGFDIRAGEVFGLVGESGSGKSVTCRALLRLFGGAPPSLSAGSIRFDGQPLHDLPDAAFTAIRGRRIALISQDPMTALNPTMTIGRQIGEAVRLHARLRGRMLRQAVVELLHAVGVTAPERRLNSYPHQFSGGMRQRVLIAIALACRPQLLIADEPTTALDVTVQDQILKLILRLRDQTGMAVLLVTHDLGVVAQTCDRVAVMYAGRIAELAETRRLFSHPSHPYTRALLRALPSSVGAREGRLEPIGGAPPDLADPPPGCRFRPRCREAIAACAVASPALRLVAAGHEAACIRLPVMA